MKILFQDLQYSRDLLIGSSSNLEKHCQFVPQHGLFTDRSKTNLFQVLFSTDILSILHLNQPAYHFALVKQLKKSINDPGIFEAMRNLVYRTPLDLMFLLEGVSSGLP